MSIRFRRTLHVLPGVHLNVSKHGISTTVGARGMHLTFNRYGVRQSVGLPGTGLSETSYIAGGPHRSGAGTAEEEAAQHVRSIHHGEGLGCVLPGIGCLAILLVAAAAVVFLGASVLGLHPATLVSQLVTPVAHSVGILAHKAHARP